jgi:hypothetical protein
MGERVRIFVSLAAALLLGLTFAVVTLKRADSAPRVVWNDPGASTGDTVVVAPAPSVSSTDLPKTTVDHAAAEVDCGAPAGKHPPDGRPMVVTIPGAPPFTVGEIPAGSWRKPPSADPTWRLNFLGLMWMKPLARRAALDGRRRSLRALVAQAVAFHRQNPDQQTAEYGWDEGTALRRLEVENCLYSLTRSATLVPGMDADAAVLLSDRYYGPPMHHVHNHGLFANLRLMRAGALLDRPDWYETAIGRIIAEQPLAFSADGITNEQSSMYQLTNVNLWRQAVDRLTGAAKATVEAAVDEAYRAFGWMTEPDGRIVQVGDSQEIAGRPVNLGATRTLRDDQAGWIIGRWSWTDPATSYYTIRYGPARFGHGHQDRAGGVTWSTRGVRVLVGPGLYTYDTANALEKYGIGPEGQNVAIPGDRKPGKNPAKVTRAEQNAVSDRYTVRDSVYGTPHVRDIDVDNMLGTIEISDSFREESSWRQSWHLDPLWRLVSSTSTRLVFAHPSGRHLTVSTTGRVSDVLRATSKPPHGWHFPAYGVKVPAAEIIVRNRGEACTTTFTVS